jgi:anthraniloyl-CoA monooxygenase
MRIVCVGAGPAGLYVAILTALRDPAAEVTVLERNPEGVTHGWGVTFSDDVLDSLYAGDPVSAAAIHRDPASWGDQVVLLPGRPVAHLGGYGFAIGRHRLLEILTDRARELGVEVRHEHPVSGPGNVAGLGADLVVAADGVNSRLRDAEAFGTRVGHGANQYVWLGCGRAFDEFTYAFEETPAGWVWFYAYPFDHATTTFIVECAPDTWAGLGFDRMGPDETRARLEGIFARHLHGAPLLMQTKGQDAAPWLRFPWVTNERWYATPDGGPPVVLAGDAAHTTHFSIGNGTKLAIDDALALDRGLAASPDLPAALAGYQAERVAAVAARQRVARNSAGWFERVAGYTDLDPTRFSFALRTRAEEGDTPASGVSWLLHRATQQALGRRARRMLSSAGRRQRARERTPG